MMNPALKEGAALRGKYVSFGFQKVHGLRGVLFIDSGCLSAQRAF